MKKQRSLKELGFKRQPREKPKRDIPDDTKRPFKGANSVSLDDLRNEFQSKRNNLAPDAPPDTGIGGGGHDDAIEKGDSGFMSYMGEK